MIFELSIIILSKTVFLLPLDGKKKERMKRSALAHLITGLTSPLPVRYPHPIGAIRF